MHSGKNPLGVNPPGANRPGVASRNRAKYCNLYGYYSLYKILPESIPITEVREKLAEIAGRVPFAGERIAVQKHGKTVAVLVPPTDLEVLEALEDRLDLLDAIEALADYEANGGVDFGELEGSLGL